MKKILVVDDQASIRHLVEIVLGTKDRQIIAAESGEKAIAIAHQKRLDFIILDLVIPGGINGIEALEALKSDPQTRDCPILILTAKALESERHRAFEFGAIDYMTKPFQLEMLMRRVQEILA